VRAKVVNPRVPVRFESGRNRTGRARRNTATEWVFRIVLLAALFACRAPAAVIGGALSDVTFSEHDSQGRLIRMIRAEKVEGPASAPVLTHGVVEFYRTDREAGSPPASTLVFDEATYQVAQRTIDGLGHVAYRSGKGVISAKGFFYDLEAMRLVLRSEVLVEVPRGQLSGDAGVVQLARDSASGEVAVEWANVDGRVTMRGPAVDKLGYDHAETNSAVYYGADETIHAENVIGYPMIGTDPSELGDVTLKVGSEPAEALQEEPARGEP